MRLGKCPTRHQKIALIAAELDPKEWLIQKALSGKLHIVHKTNGERKEVTA